MKYVEEFRNKNLVARFARKIKMIVPPRAVNIMEVCGTHTHNFFRFGLDKILPCGIRLISGPGCPVCVSNQDYIDKAIAYAKQKDVIIATFGDMLRVPGTKSSLEKEKALGASVLTVYSALDSLKLARANPSKKVVMLAVGFETTAPTIALTILAARKEHLGNLYFLTSLKLIPAAMQYLLQDKRLRIDGFLCPGHVSCIIGTKPYEFIPRRYKIGCCISGFEPADILAGIYLLIEQLVRKKPAVANQYQRAVTKNGNTKAQKIIARVFGVYDASWRGLGKIPKSGLFLKESLQGFDIEKELALEVPSRQDAGRTKGCCCAEVLKGLMQPLGCPLFKKSCTPEHPLGGCMVSEEGACNAYFRYHDGAR